MLCKQYEIISLLNTGSFSTIYLAQALALAEKPLCVLKQFKPQSDDLTLLRISKELFEREAAALRKIGKHPQISQLLDYFETDKHSYLVRDYIAGKTIREVQHQGLWDEQQAIEFLRSMLPVLAFIHQRGVIHRDIKPENIVLQSTDQKPVLIDFGAVEFRSQTTQTNASSAIIQSYGYTPPEQMAGHAEENSDLYALGMTCIEMLLGEKPASFKGRETGQKTIQQLEELEISENFRSFLDRLVHPDAQQRYQSADAAVADLNQLKIHCEPVQNGYTPTLVDVFDQKSSNLQYTSTDLVIDSSSEHPIGSRAEDSKPNSAKSRRQTVPIKHSEKFELEYELTRCLNGKNIESRIQDITAAGKTALIKYLQVLLLSASCVAIGAALLYFFHFKASATQSITKLPTGSNQAAQTLFKFQAVAQLQSDRSWVRFLEFTEGERLISASESGLVQLYDLQNQAPQQLTKTSSEILAAAYSEQKAILALATTDRSIELWNLKTRKKVQQGSTAQLVWSMAIEDTRSSLATGGLNTLQRWNGFPAKLKPAKTLEFSKQSEPVRAMTLTPDGSILAAGNATGELKVMNFDFNRSQLFHSHTQAINAVVVNTDQTILLTGSNDDTICVWNLYALQQYERPVIQAELGRVTAIAAHPNQNIVAAGGIYGTVKLWNWQTGQLIGMLSEPATEITALAFSPDGTRLAVADRNGKTTIFSITK